MWTMPPNTAPEPGTAAESNAGRSQCGRSRWVRCCHRFAALVRRLFRVDSSPRVKRILVIDDDSDMRAMLEQTLRSAGYEVVLAANGTQGIRYYHANPTSLVITDLFMPKKAGLETIIELRRDFPDVSIIAISGKPTGGTLLSIAQRLGAVKTIEKPFQHHELLRAVEEVLAAKA